ncbi:hypothetical protein SAMN02745119_01818 [Trichlorobacter thiogenes]|uniref:Uncharacterized protein n=1 Tax=Trichlorobacter thiogenes TaxID=115783 RepID=A0A1T4P1E8_9BACT|nr:hypothetical protein SAMN02745119_01818 [Trichlorobacter thiogenes]
MKKLAWLALSASVLALPTVTTAGTFGKMLGGFKQLQGGSDTQQQSAPPSSSSKNTKSRSSSQPEPSTASPSPTATVSENTVAVPRLHADHPAIAWKIGDPVQVFEKGKWYTGTVANLNYDKRPLTVRMELFTDLRWWPWNEIKPVDGYSYTMLPAQSTQGTEDAWKAGDQVELQIFWGNRFNWAPGVVLSTDGDNYYIYAPDGTGKNEKYFWKHKNQVRNAGSAKVGWQTTQPDPNRLVQQYQDEVSKRGCSFGEPNQIYLNWAFLWDYDHSFNFEDIMPRLKAKDLKSVLTGYECYAKARQNFPELPVSAPNKGNSIVGRYDVQAQLIAKHKEIIRSAVNRYLQNVVQPVARGESQISGDWVPRPLALTNGFDLLKQNIVNKLAEYKELGDVVGAQPSIDWNEIKKMYDTGVADMNTKIAASSPGLQQVNGYRMPFSSHNATIEKKASAYALKQFPKAKILATATSRTDMEIIKTNLGIPQYRYLYAAALVKHPDYRSCFKYTVRYKEDYAGGGKYAAGIIDKGPGHISPTAIEEFTRCP